jgi:hypothetical protein
MLVDRDVELGVEKAIETHLRAIFTVSAFGYRCLRFFNTRGGILLILQEWGWGQS